MDEQTQTIHLVERAQGGDRRSLERILERYYSRVERIVRVRLGPKLREVVDAADIIQETLFTAATRLETFEAHSQTSLINWMATLAEHKITDALDYHHAKKRDIDRSVPLEAGGTDSSPGIAAMPTPAPSPAEAVADAEEARIVEECLHELKDPYRELILQRNFAGASWAEIAEKLGRPSVAAARMMHAKAMVELGQPVRRRLPKSAT